MRITLLLLLCLCSLMVGEITAQSGKLTLEEKIKQDTLLMNKMTKNLERGTENVEKLNAIDEKIHQLWTRSQDTILIGERPFTKNIYDEAKVAIEEFLPDEKASIIEDIEELKNKYLQINGQEKTYQKLHNKDFKKLKRRYQNNNKSLGEKLKALNRLIRFMKKELDNESTDITGMLITGGELLTIVDEYAVEMGMETLSEDDLKMLKDDPLEFLVKKAQKHLKNYTKGKEEFENLNKIKSDLDSILHNTCESLDSLKRDKEELVRQNEKNEAIVANSKKEQQKLRQELNNLKEQLTKQQQLVQSLKSERNIISKEVNQLSNQRGMIVKDVDDKANEKQALSEATQALQDTINYKANLLLAAQQDLTATNDSLKLKQAALKNLAEEKATAERGRMLFLISSILMLLGILAMLGYERYRIRENNRRLKEEKELTEKNLLEEKTKLEKSLTLTEEFYAEYRELDKTELALQREKHAQRLQEYDDLSKLELAIQTNELEQMTWLQKETLKELRHNARGSTQTILALFDIREWFMNNKRNEELEDLKRQIKVIGESHKKHYNENFNMLKSEATFNINDYIVILTNKVKKQFEDWKEVEIIVKTDKDKVTTLGEYLIPIGMIVTEIVNNALKYGFKNCPDNPRISIECRNSNDDLLIIIQDNGNTPKNGICPRIDKAAEKLVKISVRELEGKFKYSARNDGMRYVVSFPKIPKKYQDNLSQQVVHHA